MLRRARRTERRTRRKTRKSKKELAAERKTIVIGGDDLPDTVSLDVEREEKFLERRDEERSGERWTRSTIVITDFDDVAPIDASAVRSTVGGDQRIRARRISVRRAEGRRRLRWVLLGLVAIAVPVGTLAVLASPIFDVNEVDVQGATYTDPALIAASHRRHGRRSCLARRYPSNRASLAGRSVGRAGSASRPTFLTAS